jgi:two-component sensor histidine kinase
VARTPHGKAQRLVNIVADITERKSAEDHIQFLMREMTHRSKNLLTVVQAIARRTAQTARTFEDFESRFGQRLQGLSASHDVLVDENWQGARLEELVARQLKPFAEPKGSRIGISGPPIVVSAQAAQAIGLAIHELATNATKYGALSVASGRIEICWSLGDVDDEPGTLRLSWVERGGPPVSEPTRKGFGRTVIDAMLTRSLGGKVALEFDPSGLRWCAWIPPRNLIAATTPFPTRELA